MAPATQNETPNGIGEFREQFNRFERGARQPAWLFPLRQAGFARFAELGFPTVQQEDWRFTNVAPIAKLPFKPVFEPAKDSVPAKRLERIPFASLPGTRLVFVNGHYAAELSVVRGLPAGVRITNLAAVLAADPAFVEKHLGQCAPPEDNPFTALNQAFFLDGGFIHLPAGKTVDEPIQLIFISTSKQTGATIQPRNLIVADAGSQATIIESYVAIGGASYFTNAVTEMIVGDNATIEHLKFQDEAADAFHVAAVGGQFGRASNLRLHSFALGARLSRNYIRVRLAGEGLACILNGLYLTRGEQLADHHMVVEHAQPHCASHEYFNGILDDKSRGVFHGRILVRPEAQKTDAKQTNKNLLLSDDATVNTMPQLEIYADDVKCTHGATVGQLNEESVFYLRSRGIGPEAARRMLIHAFAGEIIERIKHELTRAELDKLVRERLEANPHLAEKS
jgi:Fe-S cluster assembly protein SufD